MTNAFREMDDLVMSLFVSNELPAPLIPKQLTEAELRKEMERYLKGGKDAKELKVPIADIPVVHSNLRDLLERAEAAAGRPVIAAEYGNVRGLIPNRSDVELGNDYRRNRERYVGPRRGPQEMRARLLLARAATAVLVRKDPTIDEAATLAGVFHGTRAYDHVRFGNETALLMSAGEGLADAWWQLADALDEELGISAWFAALPQSIDAAPELVGELLGVGGATAIGTLPVEGRWFETTDRLPRPEPAAEQEFNHPRHPHDDALAPAVTLFRVLLGSPKGRLWSETEQRAGRPAELRFWREVQLQLLPGSRGGILPCLVMVPKASLHRDGREIPLRTPFTRPVGEQDQVPLQLVDDDGIWMFQPNSELDMSRGLGLATTADTVMQTAWLATDGVIGIVLRLMAGETTCPVDPRVLECAGRNVDFATHFAAGSIGSIVERATTVPDRADGIGDLLRQDFFRRAAILRRSGIETGHASALARFRRAWGSR